MEPRARESFHTAPKERVCPSCKRKGTIVFWKEGSAQRDLAGNAKREMVRLERPRCSFCGKDFPHGQKFEMVR